MQGRQIVIKELTCFSRLLKYEFPVKLYSILQDMEKEGRKDIISWLPSGDSFRIHDVEKFSEDVLPKYCNGIQYKSFIRNINLVSQAMVSDNICSSFSPRRSTGIISHYSITVLFSTRQGSKILSNWSILPPYVQARSARAVYEDNPT